MFVRPIQGASLDPSYIINLVISVCGVSPALVNFVTRFMQIVEKYYREFSPYANFITANFVTAVF